MVSRRQQIKEIERRLREIDNRRNQITSQISEQQSTIQQAKGTTREPLAQRRFGADVGQVKAQQQRTLQRRQQARGNIQTAESNIQKLQQESQQLQEARSQLVKARKTLEQIPEVERQRRQDIEEGRISVRDEDTGELVPVRGEGREETITIREIPAQRLVPPRSADQDIVRMTVGQKIVSASEKTLQNIDAKIFPQQTAENKAIEDALKQRENVIDTFNQDVALFNQEFGGRELTEKEIATAQARELKLEERARLIGIAEPKLQADIKALREKQILRGRTDPTEVGRGFASGILKTTVGIVPTAVLLGKTVKELAIPKERKISLFGGGIQAGDSRLAKEQAIVGAVGVSFAERPLATTGELLGEVLVIEAGIKGLGKFAKAKPIKVSPVPRPKVASLETIKLTQKGATGQFVLKGKVAERTATLKVTESAFKRAKVISETIKPRTTKPLLTTRVPVKAVKGGVKIQVTKPFQFQVRTGTFPIKDGEVRRATFFAQRQRGKVVVGEISGKIQPQALKVTPLKGLDKLTRAEVKALVTRGDFTVISKATKFQKGIVVTQDIAKLTRAGKVTRLDPLKTTRVASLTGATSPIKTVQFTGTKAFKTKLATQTLPRTRVSPKTIQTIKGISRVTDVSTKGAGTIIITPTKVAKKLTSAQLTAQAQTSALAVKSAEAGVLRSFPVKTTARVGQITKASTVTKTVPLLAGVTATRVTTKQTTVQTPKLTTRISPRLTQRTVPRTTARTITRTIPRITQRVIPRTTTRTITRLTPKITTRLITVTTPRTTTGLTPVGIPKIGIPRILIPTFKFPQAELPRRKRKEEKFKFGGFFVPSVTARAFKITIPKERARLGRTFTGLEIRRIPV